MVSPTDPPSLHSPTPPPALTRRESRLIQKHSSPTHKRSNTTSSLLGFVRSPPGTGKEEARGGGDGDAPNQREGESGSPRRTPTRQKRESAPAGVFRGFSYTRSPGKTQSISSGSSSSSGNSERRKRVSWKLPASLAAASGRDPSGSVMMPPCHPPKLSDAPKIEKELAMHFGSLSTQEAAAAAATASQDALPTVAPLRINKTTPSPSPAPVAPATAAAVGGGQPLGSAPNEAARIPSQAPAGRREYAAPYPARPEYVEPWKQEPTQNNHPKYTTNSPDPPSPPNSGSEEEDVEAEILKGLGRRPLPKTEGPSGTGTPPEETTPVSKSHTKYGAQVPAPPVIGIVTTPSPPPHVSAPSITVSKNNTAPTIPSISVPGDTTDRKPDPPAISVSALASTPAVEGHGNSSSSSSGKSAAPPTIAVSDTPTRTGTRPLPQPRSGPSSVYSSPSAAGRARGATAQCNLCRNPIQGRVVSAGSLHFHPECFRCDHCQTALEHVGFYPEPKEHRSRRLEKAGIVEDRSNGTGIRFYCHLDFHELFSPRCKHCKTPIEGEVVMACGSTWHQGHFFCAECGDPFTSQSKFVEKDGYAWCVACYTKRFSGKCKKCRKPVTETVVKALGGEWHEECFCCTVPSLLRPSVQDGVFYFPFGSN